MNTPKTHNTLLPAARSLPWKRALAGVAGAAFRLHRYRFVRTRMLHDALCAARSHARDGSRC